MKLAVAIRKHVGAEQLQAAGRHSHLICCESPQ